MKVTYQYRICPNQQQKNIFDWTSNELRLLYNYFLKQYCKEDKRISKLPLKDQRKEWKRLLDKQQKELINLKKQKPQLYQVQSQVLHDVLYRLLPLVWNGFLTKRKELKKFEKRWKYPRQKKKGYFNHIVYPQEEVSGVWVYKIENNKLLIKQGKGASKAERTLTIKIKYHRPIQGKIKTLTIAWKNNEYYACFSCELPKPKQIPPSEIQKQVGIDIGAINFFATSEGWKYTNPKFLEKLAEKLKTLHQSLSLKKHRRSREDKTKSSKGYEKVRLKLANLFRAVVRRINDRNHKLSRKLVDKFDLITYEDLKLSKAFEKQDKKRKFSKYTVKDLSELRVADFFSKLVYKAETKGKIVKSVSPVNTSKTCFECKMLNPNLEKQRWFICANCGYEADRDINASKNILHKAQTELGTLPSERV